MSNSFRPAALGICLLCALGCDSYIGLQVQHRIAGLTGYTTVSTNHVPGVGDIRFFLDPNDKGMTEWFKRGEPWEPNESHWFVRTVKKGDTVVDVGANIGYYTLLAGHLVGDEGRVYAFEPDPANFVMLERNVRLNGLTNVVLEQKAVSNEAGSIQLFLREEHFGDHRIYQPKGESRRSIDIEAVSLDDYFRGREAEIDFLKIDTQGAEAAIAKGMKQLVRANDKLVVVIEYSPRHLRDFGSEPAELITALTNAGFAFFDLGMGGPPRGLEGRSPGWLLDYDPPAPYFTNLYCTKTPSQLPDQGKVVAP